ncbi:MAG: hypothetical protein P4K92_04810 [Candidatus Nitrosotalea sp.]|nr:hypothetical protein [Candidatus Nitrosotalea sp.]
MTENNNEVTLEEMKKMIEKHVRIDGLSVQGIRIIYEDLKASDEIKKSEEDVITGESES